MLWPSDHLSGWPSEAVRTSHRLTVSPAAHIIPGAHIAPYMPIVAALSVSVRLSLRAVLFPIICSYSGTLRTSAALVCWPAAAVLFPIIWGDTRRKKSLVKKIEKYFKKGLTKKKPCAILVNVKRNTARKTATKNRRKNFWKIFQKTLDKLKTMCYT